MKGLKRTVPMLIMLFMVVPTHANPIVWRYLWEFQLDDTGFNMELMFMEPQGLDGWYLTSLTDTAYFNDSLTADNQFFVVTQANLQEHLTINPAGDVIGIHSAGWDSEIDEFRFGDVPQSYVAAPQTGQSICLSEYALPSSQGWHYYLDNTPTFGAPNDSSGAMGYITGTVTDTLGSPVAGVRVVYAISYMNPYGEPEPIYVATNENGRYSVYEIARRVALGYCLPDSEVVAVNDVQILPGDTATVDFVVHDFVDIHPENQITIKTLELNAVYPNPFNSVITIVYTLPSDNYLEISVYDIKGRLADQVFSGSQSAGKHALAWNAGQLPAGVYFIYLQTPQGSINRKCVYLK